MSQFSHLYATKGCISVTLTKTQVSSYNTYTCTFNGPLSRTTQVSWYQKGETKLDFTQVSWYQKGETKLDFTEARDSEWQWHQLGHMQSAPRSRQITTPAPHHSVFYRRDALPATQPTAPRH